MSVIVKYANGVLMTYTANTYLPYEGPAIAFNGTKGRIDYRIFKGGGFAENELPAYPEFWKVGGHQRSWPRAERRTRRVRTPRCET